MATREYRRRHVVRTAGLLAATGVAGCLDNEEGAVESGDQGTDTPADDRDDGDVEAEDPDGDDTGADDVERDDAETADTESDGEETTDDDPADSADDTEDADEEDPDETETSDGEDASENDASDDEASDPEDDEGTTDGPDGFDTYTNEELGYAVAHPEGWEVDDGGEEVYIADPDGGRELGILVFDATEFGSVDTLAAEFLAGLEADYDDVEIREEGDRVLESGQDARLLDIAYVNPDDDRGRRRSRMLFAIDPETDAGYVAEVAASAEAFDDAVEARADAMLDSFRLEGDGSASLDAVGLSSPIGSPLPTRP